MTHLDIPSETFEAAQRVKMLRARLEAAKAEVARIDAELQDALNEFQPLKAAAIKMFLGALGDGGDNDPNHVAVYRPQPPFPHRRGDPPKAA